MFQLLKRNDQLNLRLKKKEDLGAVHKCQHFYECTNHTLSENPPPPKNRVHINIF